MPDFDTLPAVGGSHGPFHCADIGDAVAVHVQAALGDAAVLRVTAGI